MAAVIRTLIGGRWASFGVVALGLLALVVAGRRVGYEQSIRSFFGDDDPDIRTYNRASAAFGDDNFVFVTVDDPDLISPAGMGRVADLARSLGRGDIPGVVRVESLDAMPLLWKVDDALIEMDRLPRLLREGAKATLRKAVAGATLAADSPFAVGGAVRAADAAGRAELKRRLTSHPLFVGTLIDRVGTTAACVVRLAKTEDHDVKATVAAIRARADAFAGRHGLPSPAVVGPPVLLADGFRSIDVDGRRLAIVGMVLIGVVTLTATRSCWWAVVPIMSGWAVWLATEWVLATFDLRLSLSGGPLVAQIIVLTMPAASHLAIHFRDERRKGLPLPDAARATLGAVSSPILWCAVTGAIGYGALATSNVAPIRQFGWIMGSCTLLASFLVMGLAPAAMLPPFRLELPIRVGSVSRLGSAVDRLTAWVYRHPLPVVVGLAAAVVPIAAGMGRLTYETNYINAFKPETRVVRDYGTVESRLGGIGVVELVVPTPGPIDPAALAKFRAVERGVMGDGSHAHPALPGATSVVSVATVLDPEGRIAALPADAATRILATKLDLIAASPQADLLRGFLNPKTREARILVRLVEQQATSRKTAIFRAASDRARAEFGPESYLTGLSLLMTRTTEGIIQTQWATFFYSVVGILAMLTVALRGPILAALAMIPTLMAVALVLGLMGWLGIKLDMATALVASVALGLSVDDTFHCLLQYRRQRRAGRDFRSSLFASYSVSGPGVVLSSVAVAVGFLALRSSEFAPFANFGAMVAIATAGSTLGNILFLPACLTLRDRWLARRRGRLPDPATVVAPSIREQKNPTIPDAIR